MGALVFAQVPYADVAAAVAGDEFPLVRVDDDVVDGEAVVVVALHARAAGVPDLDRAVLGAGDHPLALAVERDAGHVARVPVKGQDRARVCRADVVELDVVVAGRGEVALIRRDAEPVDLGVRVLDRARADPRQRFPEPDGVVIACSAENDGHCFLIARGSFRGGWPNSH